MLSGSMFTLIIGWIKGIRIPMATPHTLVRVSPPFSAPLILLLAEATDGTFTEIKDEKYDNSTELSPFRSANATYWNSDDVRGLTTATRPKCTPSHVRINASNQCHCRLHVPTDR